MKLISLKIKGFKNLDFWENPIDFTKSEGISIFVGNNGSGKSNVLEAISAIFYGLYDETNERRCAFSYELEYFKDGKNIKVIQQYTKGGISIGPTGGDFMSMMGEDTEMRMVGYYIDGVFTKNIDRGLILPYNIIALYSGEETRLYEKYYQEYYQNFIISVKNNKLTLDGATLSFDTPKMIFINKDFWNIALLTILISVYDFETDELYKGVENILGKGIKINEIEFDIDEKNLEKFKENDVTNFVKIISSKNDWTLESLRKYSDDYGTIGSHLDFFWHLSIACFGLTKNDKLINNINLKLIDNIPLLDLSEGQKKQLLIYFVTNILVSNNSLVLLDEPDSYIHVGNKQKLKILFENYLINFGEGEVIMTTHSPTLMNKFNKKHLFYLENGKLDLKEKREILDKITDGQMSLNEMEILLNSGNKYLLVTEGITDKKHLEIAIEKLGIKNQFDIYSCDGADKLKQFLLGIPKDFFKNKVVVGIFDYDNEGLKQIKQIGDSLEDNKKYKVKERDNIFGITLPCPNTDFETHKNCPIEFLYSKEILKTSGMISKRTFDDINHCITNVRDKLNQDQIDKKEDLYFYKISESDTSKNNFTEKVRILDSGEFENFRILFNIILDFNSH